MGKVLIWFVIIISTVVLYCLMKVKAESDELYEELMKKHFYGRSDDIPASDKTEHLKVKDISKNYNRYSALRGVNLELEPGLYGLLGPNGAGKSTLLKIIAGILRPTAGSILLDNEPVSKLGEHYRAMLGYMPQDLGIYPEFTAKRYLLYIAALKGLTEAQAKAEIDKLLEAVGLSSNAEQKLKGFSGGMLRRVGIAQTLLCNPQILLLDEPTAGLDPQERVRLRNLLSALAQHSIIILSTHIVSDVELIAEKIILLREGQIAAFDTVAGLVGKSTLEDVYLTYFQKEA